MRGMIAVSSVVMAAAGLACAGPVLINEFVADHTGNDAFEFIEVVGRPNTNYGHLRLLHIEGDLGGTVMGTIDSVDVVGSTDPRGIFTTSPFFSNRYENGTKTFLLVSGFTGAQGQDLDTNDDGVLDFQPWTAVIDAIGVSDGGSGDSNFGFLSLLPGFGGNPFTVGGASRIPHGRFTGTIADWMRNDFDGAGLPGLTGTPVVGEAFNTPNDFNRRVPGPGVLALAGIGGLAAMGRRRR